MTVNFYIYLHLFPFCSKLAFYHNPLGVAAVFRAGRQEEFLPAGGMSCYQGCAEDGDQALPAGGEFLLRG